MTLDNTIEGVLQGTSSPVTWELKLTDPCPETVINSQNATGQTFDKALDNYLTPQMSTSVLVGTDEASTPSGVPIIKTFTKHTDEFSNEYTVTGTPYVCGARLYTLTIIKESNGVDVSTASTFALYDDVPDYESTISIYSALNTDVGFW